MTITWSGGTPIELIARIETRIHDFRATAGVILGEIVKEAAIDQEAALNAAHTTTGEARMAANGPGTAGRNRTGHMIGEITSETHDEGDLLVGTWGWDNPEDYFIQQEYGTARIAGAFSLYTSMIAASAKLDTRIRKALETF